MKGIIEEEIEKFADKYGKYPEIVEVSETEWNKLQKELRKELTDLGIRVPDEIRNFRGCRLILKKNLSKFIVR